MPTFQKCHGSADNSKYAEIFSLSVPVLFRIWTEIIKNRLNKQASIGFIADLKDKYDEDKNILDKVTVEDLREFGMIPEFLGRLPVIFSLQGLTQDMMVEILRKPKNAIIRQYRETAGDG